jgi:hypothetical protein
MDLSSSCSNCGLSSSDELVTDYHQGDVICRICGTVVFDHIVDYSNEGNRSFREDGTLDLYNHHSKPTSILSSVPESSTSHQVTGEAKYIMKSNSFLTQFLENCFGTDCFPREIFETASHIMRVCVKESNRKASAYRGDQKPQVPKDMKYNMYTSLLLSILVTDKYIGARTRGPGYIGLRSGDIISAIKEITGVDMKEKSLNLRIRKKFAAENSLREWIEEKLNFVDKDWLKYEKNNGIKFKIVSLNNFNLFDAAENRAKRIQAIENSKCIVNPAKRIKMSPVSERVKKI